MVVETGDRAEQQKKKRGGWGGRMEGTEGREETQRGESHEARRGMDEKSRVRVTFRLRGTEILAFNRTHIRTRAHAHAHRGLIVF